MTNSVSTLKKEVVAATFIFSVPFLRLNVKLQHASIVQNESASLRVWEFVCPSAHPLLCLIEPSRESVKL